MASSATKRTADHGSSFHSKKKKPKSEDKKESSTRQKRALKHERQSHRRHADSVTSSKELWNKLRRKTNTPEETRELMDQLMKLIKGKMVEIALQHDASRVVQAAIQFGTPQQRREICKELCAGDVVEMAKSQYAHFVVLKMIKYCAREEECVHLLCKALKGSIPKLAVHAVGARVMELLFSTFSSKQTSSLKQELYGPHVVLFGSGADNLASIVEQLPEKKDVTMQFVVDIIHKATEKSLLGFAYIQELTADYISVASPNDVRALAASLSDHSIHMLSTRAGTRLVASCASYGTPKDRKRILKSLKGYTKSSLLHRDAYLALLALVQVVDDTVSIHKSLLAEIISEEEEESPLLEIACHETGSRFFLILLAETVEERNKYLDPYEHQVLEPRMVIENGVKVPTSKKNPDTRRKELLNYLRKPLIDMCCAHAHALVRSLPGSRVLCQVYSSFRSQQVVDAAVNVCVKDLSIFEDAIGHYTIKHLILCDTDDKDAVFATSFLNKMEGKLMQIAQSNRGAFVITALVGIPTSRTKALDELSSHKSKLRKLASGKKATAGYKALLQELD